MITQWEDAGRTDLNMIPTMIEAGFTPDFNHKDKSAGRITPENCPCYPVSFSKGNLYTWKTIKETDGGAFERWIVAELIDGRFCNHRMLNNLSELFENN